MHDNGQVMMVVTFSFFSRTMRKGGRPYVHHGPQHARFTGVAHTSHLAGGAAEQPGQPPAPRRARSYPHPLWETQVAPTAVPRQCPHVPHQGSRKRSLVESPRGRLRAPGAFLAPFLSALAFAVSA